MDGDAVTPTANILSVDVEDWFHVDMTAAAIAVERWSALESRVEASFGNLLDIFSEADVSTTCFFLGWVAERYPGLVRDAARRGHEVASHGYAHRLVASQSRAEFAADIRKTREILEQTAGVRVIGYRAPSFSITRETRWALEELAAAGYEYDSSIFPIARDYGGVRGMEKAPHRISTASGSIIEFPISVARLLGRDMCFFGGGYLRLYPYALIKRMSRRVNLAGRPVIYYVHPREIDPEHPRLPMPAKKKFKVYHNLASTAPKLRALLHDQKPTSFRAWLTANGESIGGAP